MGHNNRIYTIADLHFRHKKMIESGTSGWPFATIEEHDECLTDLWNETVRPKDTVIVPGDVYFGGSGNHIALKKLNGFKKLVLGNHDVYPLEYYQQYFSKIFGVLKIRKCIISHIPILFEDSHLYRGNIHGHLHRGKIDDPRYRCVSAEQINFKPVLLDEIIDSFPPLDE